ncbi:transglutaminase-like domain-containing protein [Chitinimonas sp. PSY-7]|uniref:transglutaminase domain-containing protein n=1 Tax=Chitinimonas sp. PSY-7 TaxID=3459088 RepID=UPI0040402C15
MLVTTAEQLMMPEAVQPGRNWRRGAWVCVGILLLGALSLLPYVLGGGVELVRLRNAWVLEDTRSVDFDWTPDSLPADYKVEPGPPMPFFTKKVKELGLAGMADDWQRATAISDDLLSSAPALRGGAVQDDLLSTYRDITERGDGYCGDFVRTFSALALAADIPVRQWAFSFDGFGGYGHIWPEIWNRQQRKWQLLDIFNNAYFTGPDGQILSALAFRQAMLTKPDSIQMHRVVPTVRPGYIDEAKAWDYYRRGLNEWYLWWGNNVFEYDQAWLVQALGDMHRSLEQVGGIVQGVQPHVQVLAEPANMTQLQAMWALHVRLRVLVVVSMLALFGLIVCLIAAWRAKHLGGAKP